MIRAVSLLLFFFVSAAASADVRQLEREASELHGRPINCIGWYAECYFMLTKVKHSVLPDTKATVALTPVQKRAAERWTTDWTPGIIEGWRRHYNEVPRHSSLGCLTPAVFAAKFRNDDAPAQATAPRGAACGASAHGPVAQPLRKGHIKAAMEAVPSS